MSAMTAQNNNDYGLSNCLFTDGFPYKGASNAEDVSIA